MMVLYFVLQILLLTVAVAIGFGLHWCIPDLNIGLGILAGILSSIATAYFVVQLMRIGYIRDVEMDLDDQNEDCEDEITPDLHISAPPVKQRRRRRKR